jgi:hypothetical protein
MLAPFAFMLFSAMVGSTIPAGRQIQLYQILIGSSATFFILLAMMAWAFSFRGGLALSMLGFALVRSDGRKAARWQCAWRVFLIWWPVVILLISGIIAKVIHPDSRYLLLVLWCIALIYMAAYAAFAVWLPARSLHDRLAGTYVVPK